MTGEHEMWMGLALDLAREAAAAGEVPVGAIVVKDGRVIGRGANRREADQDPVAHAEILAIAEAAHAIGCWRLEGMTLYATLEPCPMCAGAIVNARIPLLVYGCDDPKAGSVRSLYALLGDPRLNHRCEAVAGVRAGECAELLTEFFEKLRAQGKK